MEFTCKYSAKDFKFFQTLEAGGKDVPALRNMPELFFDAAPFWIAFSELSSSRQSGMSLGSIPYSEISSWLDENDIISFEQRSLYRRFITKMDNKYVELKNKTKKK